MAGAIVRVVDRADDHTRANVPIPRRHLFVSFIRMLNAYGVQPVLEGHNEKAQW
jgi:hypothetical protein